MTGDNVLDLSGYPKRHVQESASPFRYPGGKAFLTGYLATQLETMDAGDRHYAEPFCGGAGAAINLLQDGSVGTVHLNDADIRIYSAWRGGFIREVQQGH